MRVRHLTFIASVQRNMLLLSAGVTSDAALRDTPPDDISRTNGKLIHLHILWQNCEPSEEQARAAVALARARLWHR